MKTTDQIIERVQGCSDGPPTGNDGLLRAETSYVHEVLSAMIRFVKRGTI